MPVTPQQLRLKAGILHSVDEVSGSRHIWVVLHLSLACQEIHRCFLHPEIHALNDPNITLAHFPHNSFNQDWRKRGPSHRLNCLACWMIRLSER